MKRNQLIILIVMIFFICIGLTSVAYTLYLKSNSMPTVIGVGVIDIDVKIEDVEGIALMVDNNALPFGILEPGREAARKIYVHNNLSETLVIQLEFSGEVAPWMGIAEESFYLEPDEIRDVKVSMTVPEDTAKDRNYSGTLKIYQIRT